MKIHFDNVVFSSTSGPNTFAHRLANQFFLLGHEVVDYGNQADVSLVFIEPSGATLSSKTVQRLDGVWTKPEDFYHRNKNIKSFYHQTNAVIFQSEYDYKFITKHWHIPTKSKVIHNGIVINPCSAITSVALQNLRDQNEMIFCCSANWHRQKRLKENIELFKHLQQFYASSALLVLGNNPDHFVSDKSIFYTGSVPEEIYNQIYAMSNWGIHLGYLDHCPNTVIEMLMQGTPVIYPSDGGTKELVQGFGLEIQEQTKFNLEPFDYDQPPQIDIRSVGKLPNKTSLGEHLDLDIKNAAEQYLEVFENVVRRS